MAMMMYKDFVDKVNDNPVLNQSDETVQQAILDWFKYRYIGFEDPAKFLDILQRNVKVNYPMYKQKLRIEPGLAEYDWLVGMYRERQLEAKGANSSITTYNSTSTGTKTGSDTNTQSGGQTNTRTGNQTNTKTGGHTTTDTQGKHTQTYAPHVNEVTTNGGHVSNWSGTTQVDAVLPMSKTYDHQQEGAELKEGETPESQGNYFKSRAYEGMPSVRTEDPYNVRLDWHTVSSQSQNGNRAYTADKSTVTKSYEYGEDVTGNVTTNTGDKDNPDKNEVIYNNEKDTLEYNQVQDRTVYDDVKNTHVYNNLTDKNDHTGSDSVESGDRREDRERVTGRNEDPATILMRATSFIERSSAWLWLKEQLEPCFFPGYYTDGVTDEGSALI